MKAACQTNWPAFGPQPSPERPKVKVLGRKPSDSILEKPVFRPRQAEIFPQRAAFIFVPENPALLQFRHHAVDEVIKSLRQIREQDVETVAPVSGRQFLHL